MLENTKKGKVLKGLAGTLPIPDNDEITPKLAMLFEGQCEGHKIEDVCEKFGISRQWYHSLLHRFTMEGAEGLKMRKKGPRRNYRREGEVTRQVIRYRCLDPDISAQVIAQRIRQNGMKISNRSVDRIIAEYGLQKKTASGKTKRTASTNTNLPHKTRNTK